MRNFFILFLLISSVVNTNAQEIQAENIPKNHSEIIQDHDNSSGNELLHQYICRRCGSENQIDWAIPKDKRLELIPHCGFCGKKYWPKFKPSGFLERTYSLLDSRTIKAN